jgi:WD40 repeat protein
MSVAASGGTPVPATTLDAARGDASHLYPVFLPGGRRFVFVARNIDPEKTALVGGDLDSKATRVIARSDSAAAWSPTGHLLFAREGTLLAQRFDPKRLAVEGEVTPVVRDVRYATDTNDGSWSAAGGTLVYRLWPHDRNLVWVDRKGAALGTLGGEADYDDVAISPDGRRVATSIRDAAHGHNLDVWVIDADRGAATRVTSERSDEFHPIWHPDGETLFYVSDRAGPYDLYRRPATGGPEAVVFQTKWDKIVMDASPDGKSVAFTGSPSQNDEDIWILPLAGAGEARVAIETDRFTETGARFSPDGASFAFTSTESGLPQVYVGPVSGGPKRLVSSGVAYSPIWRRDGQELFYVTGDGRLDAVPIAASPTGPVPGTPQPLFDLKAANASAFSPEVYDVAPDGQRFLVVRQKSEDAPGLTVRLHWAALLQKEKP